MKIGVPREIKPQETRVSVIPVGVKALVMDGHRVMVEKNAGSEAGYPDEEYMAAGATLAETAAEVFDSAELIVKVKEPLPTEYALIRPDQIVFTFFHFAASEELTRAMQKSGALCVAYETLELHNRELPILKPMSEIAGRLATMNGATLLEKQYGGRGVVLGGVPGVKPSTVTVVGGGTAGENAARIAAGMGARVYILDLNLNRLEYLSHVMQPNVTTIHSNPQSIAECCAESDLVIGSVLIPGTSAPKLITREILRSMKPGSVFADISVDQGGCAETTRPTTHHDPAYLEEGVIHYAVANIPGAVGVTSTIALTNVTLPYVRKISAMGRKILDDPVLDSAINIDDGQLIYSSLLAQYVS